LIINLRQLRLLLIAIPLLLVFTFLYKYALPEREEHLASSKPEKLYGEFLTWTEARKYFNKYSSATVIDLDTGMQFNVQRRGGTYHADVQPLTAEDTATMKAIYNGKWSWKRRAVIVELENGRKIAASMNGMPHGRGAIAGNNFKGHSCIHFRDSTTHGSRKVDLAHQMMVWKAANVVEKQIKTLGPEDSIKLFFTAIDQGEMKLAGSLLDGEEEAAILELFRNYDYIRVSAITRLNDNIFKVNVLLGYDSGRKQLQKDISLKMVKKNSYWHIDVGSIVVLLQQPGLNSRQS